MTADTSTPTPAMPRTWADSTPEAKASFAARFPVHVGVDVGKHTQEAGH